MICENLDWLIVMLRNSDADIEVRKHRNKLKYLLLKMRKMNLDHPQMMLLAKCLKRSILANDVENETITPTTGRTSSDGSIENREDIV
ncbi:uncharacterized protein [Arachis hypogaea]|uniref:uncharacterized protein isoform X3 n=1 Tax=Arachis hypogaea TaxID=3818 RepID=UPI003B21B8DF